MDNSGSAKFDVPNFIIIQRLSSLPEVFNIVLRDPVGTTELIIYRGQTKCLLYLEGAL